jgi:predicted ester cyclase
MSAEDNKTLVRRFFEDAWNKHNPAMVDDIYAADFVDRSPDIPGIAHTRDGLKTLMGGYLIAFPDARISIEDQLVDGDRVVTRWTGAARRLANSWACRQAARR